MHWVLKPRLNSAVATVAVLMVFSLLRVASLSLVMCLYPSCPSFRGARSANLRCATAHRGISRFRVWSFGPSRNDGVASINRRLIDRRAKAGFEKIEIAALVGLPDVPGEHPAIAALEAGLRLLPFGAAFCQFRFRDIEIDGAGSDIQ